MIYCECTKDGFCTRYNRLMGGRMRELCAGINIDLGTAAAFREQWAREAGTPSQATAQSIRLLLKTDQAPGDAVVMTAAIYSLHKAHPGKYLIAVESLWPEVFEYNPDVAKSLRFPVKVGQVPWNLPSETAVIRMHYPAIHQSNDRGIHFMQGWCEFLGTALNIQVPLLTNRPHIYFTNPALPVEDYWVICSGGKSDFTNKMWGHDNYQKVVGKLSGKVRLVQVGENSIDHPPLYMCDGINMVGKTSLRDLFDITRRARGVICGVSLLMHVAAALEKPAIVIAGGREPVQWNAYPKQHYLHTVGTLSCSTPQGHVGGACWRSRTVPLGDNAFLDKDTCERPVGGTPECMTMIHPEEVAEVVLRYENARNRLESPRTAPNVPDA